jgi:transcriptional regulator with XRE-family HTH domain
MHKAMARGFDRGEDIGARIAELRSLRDMTVEELASKMGVTTDAVQRLLRGESTAQYLKLIRMARALDTTPDTVLGFSEPDYLKVVLAVCFDSLGLPADQVEPLAETVEQVLRAPPVPGLDLQSRAKAQAPLLLQTLLRSKAPKSQS